MCLICKRTSSLLSTFVLDVFLYEYNASDTRVEDGCDCSTKGLPLRGVSPHTGPWLFQEENTSHRDYEPAK